MGKKEKIELPVVVTNAPPPAYLEKSSEGFENVRQQDIVLPRIVLMQGLSPAVVEGTLKPGDMINSLTNEVICERDEEIEIIPVYHFVSWIEWGDRKAGEGMKAMSMDPKSEIAQAAARGEKIMRGDKEVFRVTEYHNIIVLICPVLDPPDLVMIGFCKTSFKVGKKFLGLARLRGSYPLYAGKYVLTSQNETKNGNTYRVYNVRNNGWALESEFAIAKRMYQTLDEGFKQSLVKVNMENDDIDAQDVADFETANDKEF